LLIKGCFEVDLNSKFFAIGIADKVLAMNLLKKSKIVLMICRFYVIFLSVGCFVVMAITSAFNYNLMDFFLFGISWSILAMIWGYHVCIAVYYFAGYYFIVSYYLNSRLNSLVKLVKSFENSVKYSSTKVKSLKITELLIEHNDLCVQINDYNKYWKKYLSSTLSILLSLICFLSYVVFFPPMDWLLRFEFAVALSAHIIVVLIVTYSASSITDFNEILYRDLHSISVKLKFSTDVKLKVSSVVILNLIDLNI